MKNPKVIVLSVIALLCLVATFIINWLFIIPAAILSGIGWKILMKN